VLTQHPDIEHAAVVGLPDAEYGQRIAAAVTLARGARLSEDSLRALCAARLAAYKIPTEFRVVAELPRNVVGKIQRRDVAAMLADP
jgi:acyl-coenzyme A synthetase/AMP-(fatty) acid ligase